MAVGGEGSFSPEVSDEKKCRCEYITCLRSVPAFSVGQSKTFLKNLSMVAYSDPSLS